MLEALITSKTRIKLLLKFFLNSNSKAWLRSLETEFGESTNSIRLELNRLQNAGLLVKLNDGNKKVYQANTSHPLFPEINNILLKHIGVDRIIDSIVKNIGELNKVYLVGELAKGNNSNMIDLWLVGNKIDKNYLLKIVEKAEIGINRKIRYLILNEKELEDFIVEKNEEELLLLWKS
ncbi:MAG TPA: ArsR family transcriptional regulator [Bacteroidales bacterium]